MNKVRFIDLFAGIGGNRKGFENAFNKCGYETECVFTSEIKPHACKVLKANYPNERIYGDITKISANTIPDFDFLLAGFPCQAFSFAGKRLGFQDTRGTLFFEVERILKEKKPFGFILENVEGLVTHDREDPKQPIGKTLTVILDNLDALGYKVSWKVLNSKYFGVAQERKRIYIVGTEKEKVSLESFKERHTVIADILERGQPTIDSEFTRLLMSRFTPEQLYGKSIKDKRGGKNNIHSWDIGIRGNVTEKEKDLLNLILTERRKKKKAEMTDSEIEAMVEKRFLEYVKDSGINLCLYISTMDGVIKRHEQLITELNYEERGYPNSVDEEVKYAIVDNIVEYVNKAFSGYEEDAKRVARNSFNQYKAKYDNKMKWYKRLSIGYGIMALIFSLLWFLN